MTSTNSEINNTSIELLYFISQDGIIYLDKSQKLVKLSPGNYRFVYKSSNQSDSQMWVSKIDELSTQEANWVVNTNKNEIVVNFTGSSLWITAGLTTDFAEYIKGSKKVPDIVSDSWKIEIDQGFIYIPPSNPAPSASKVALPVQIDKLKELAIPIIYGTPTPTPSKKPTLVTNTIYSKFSMFTQLDSVSPIIDAQQLSYTLVKNQITNFDDAYLIEAESSPSSVLTAARYITKPVKLLEESMASGFFTSFAAMVPQEAKIFVFYKILNTVESSSLSTFSSQPWIFFNSSGERKSKNQKDYIDFEFSIDQISYPENITIQSFDMFSIKIVMISSNPSKIPKIKDFRVMVHS